MKVFISWSKKLGLEIATKTKKLLESIDNSIKAFVSEIDIIGGEEVQSKIIENIDNCDKLILCFTKETKRSPWLIFEAGYARGCGKVVIPFLFDADPQWHSWIDNPMNIAREIRLDSNGFILDFIKTFNLQDSKMNRAKIKKYHEDLLDVKGKHALIDTECEDLVYKLIADGSFFVENPFYNNKTTFFLTGFESFELYKVILDQFLYSGKHLWIYGRKNMKLFSGNFNSFFNYLRSKTFSSFEMDGIDFRCLFLDPNSKEVQYAHKQQDIFVSELKTSILRAKSVVGNNSLLKKSFRFYSNKREEIIIRLDNCIIYALPSFDANGCPQLLTNSPFEVFSANSERGKNCIKKFEEIWNEAKPMS